MLLANRTHVMAGPFEVGDFDKIIPADEASRTLETAPEGCELIHSTEDLGPSGLGLTGTVYIIGGAQIYAALMSELDEVVLTYVFDEYEGDTFLPEFESGFEVAEVLMETDAFEVRRHVRKQEA